MLKTLMLRKKIDENKAELEKLMEKREELKVREAELEQAIEEAETDEETATVEEAVEEYDKEKTETDEKIAELETKIEELETEIEEMEKKTPAVASERTEKKEERKEATMNVRDVKIRELPKTVRAMDAIPYDIRTAMVEREDVQDFLKSLRNAGESKRAVSGAELNIPVVLLDIISENLYRYSKLVNRVRVRPVAGQARQTIAGTIPEAVWTEMCGAINELDFVFNQYSFDGYKVAGYVPVCNSVLEDSSDIDLASWVVEAISEAIGLAKDKAILYGKGSANKMPLGIVTRLAQTSKPTDYPANAPEWVDYHTSNVIEIDDTLTGAEFWSALTVATSNCTTPYARGTQFWAMNSKTYALLKSKAITFTASGDVVANVFDTLPVITGNIDILEFIPDGDIIGGYGDLYLWAQRAGMTIDQSEHVQFLQDNTVFRGKERADGAPVVAGAFVAVNINGTAVTTAMDFAGDKANDAQLINLSVGSANLSPTFAADTYAYTVTVTGASGDVTATPAQSDAEIAIEYDGKNVVNGKAITYVTGSEDVTVTVKQGNAVRVYTVTVTKSA